MRRQQSRGCGDTWGQWHRGRHRPSHRRRRWGCVVADQQTGRATALAAEHDDAVAVRMTGQVSS